MVFIILPQMAFVNDAEARKRQVSMPLITFPLFLIFLQ